MTLSKVDYDRARLQTRAPEEESPPDPLTTRHRPLYAVAVGLVAVAFFLGLIFTLEARFPLTPGFTILIVCCGVVGVSGGCAAVQALAVKLNGVQMRSLRCEVRRATIEGVAEVDQRLTALAAQVEALTRAVAEYRQVMVDLGSIPGDVRTKVEVFSQQLDQRCQEMGGGFQQLARTVIAEVAALRAESAEMQSLVENRLDRAEVRMERAEETARQAATAEAVIARAIAADGGQVHQLRPHNGSSLPYR